MALLLISVFLSSVITCSEASELAGFRLRRAFHDDLCRDHPNVPTCHRPFTVRDYREELEKQRKEESAGTRSFQASRRSDWVDDDIDQRDLEYYLWRKRRRQYLRRKAMLRERYRDRMEEERDREDASDYHYHYHEAPRYGYGRYSPYSGYGYGYPRYGYGGGYSGYGGGYGGYGYGGGLLGNIVNIGAGSGLGIATPIGGFGISHGWGIGIG